MRENKKQVSLLPPWGGGRGEAGFLKAARVGTVPWLGQEAELRWSARPLGGAVCGDHAQRPAFAPHTSEVAVGFWPFCIFFVWPHLRHMELPGQGWNLSCSTAGSLTHCSTAELLTFVYLLVHNLP